MPDLELFQVDAFASRPFQGNPAAVCPLDNWLPDAVMQAIALENNLSETAFFVGRPDGDIDLRWFTPAMEVDLCGHATLGTAHVIFTHLAPERRAVTFHTRSGPLTVTRADGRLEMDFPAQPPVPKEPGALGDVAGAIGVVPQAVLAASYSVALLADEASVRGVTPDFRKVAALDPGLLIVTAPGEDCDFVSRFFAPAGGIDEDPVTGSAHCILVPYWADRLGKTDLHARQVSRRGGELWCSHRGDRVGLAGHCVDYLRGRITVPDGIDDT